MHGKYRPSDVYYYDPYYEDYFSEDMLNYC